MNICPPPPAPLDDPSLPAPRLGDRSLFPSLGFSSYLGHAAISPGHLVSERAVLRCVSDLSRHGAAAFPAYAAQRERLRTSLGELLNAPAQHLALTSGTTASITHLALSLPLGPRDEVVLAQGEFPANVVPFQQAASSAGARVSFLPAPEATHPRWEERLLESVRARLVQGARFVALSAVQFQTGLRMPIAQLGALCREHDAHLLVDAIQAVGATPLSVAAEEISALTGGGHKWLLGSEGAGYLYVAPRLRAELRPKTLGWTSFAGGDEFLFGGAGLLRYDRDLKPGAEVFEGSTLPLLPLVALEAGVSLVIALGQARIFEHLQRFHELVEPGLERLGFRSLRASEPRYRSGSLSFLPPSRALPLKPFSLALRARGVLVSIPDGCVRLSPHFENALDEVPLVTEAFADVLSATSSPG